MIRLLALLFTLALFACASGDPLPQATGPWEPLNGWRPDVRDQAAATVQVQAPPQ